MTPIAALTRRTMFLGLTGMAAGPAAGAVPAGGLLRFAVLRNDAKVGEQEMHFTSVGGLVTMTSSVSMVIRLGPVPVFRYSHHAREQWRDGRFQLLETATFSNGKREQVSARRTGAEVTIETLKSRLNAPATAAPLTHWNTEAFAGPMFNPQTGELLKISARRMEGVSAPGRAGDAVRWSIRGEAEIDNWYEDGVWTALRGRLTDRSTMDYRRL